MSDDFLRIIPTQPAFVPDEHSQKIALEALRRMLPSAHELTIQVTDQIEFIDQGSNFVSVTCPNCKSELSVKWWHDVMDNSYKSHFARLGVISPCCNTETSLNDLLYDFPAGFARFALEAMNPNIGEDLPESSIVELQTILGCKLKQIWAHY